MENENEKYKNKINNQFFFIDIDPGFIFGTWFNYFEIQRRYVGWNDNPAVVGKDLREPVCFSETSTI